MVAGQQAVALADLTVALGPVVILAHTQSDPLHKALGGQLGAVAPAAYVIDDFIASVVGHPLGFQSTPSTFFKLTFSSISSAMTSFFTASLASSCCTRRSAGEGPAGLVCRSNAAAPPSKSCFCH